MSEALISAENIYLEHNEKNVLDNVSFKINTGEFVTLIGPNGAGKSSLIEVLLGLLSATDGKVRRNKKVVIGYTPQNFIPNPFIPISVINFLKLDGKFNQHWFDEVIELCGIEAILHNPLKSLSGGELQRVLLTRAMLKKPNLLILDEPVQNLDINGQMLFYRLIETIHETQNCAVLMVSHDLHHVMKRSNKVLCLFHHICCFGQPDTVIRDSQFNDLFADQMDDLLATYEHHHNHCHDH